MDRYLTVRQVAERLQVKPVTIRVWLHRGLDIPHLKINTVLRFPESRLERWLESRERERARGRFEI